MKRASETQEPETTDAILVERVLPLAVKRLITIQAVALLTDAAKLLCDTNRSLLVVCNSDGVMVGVITKTDIVRQIAHCEGSRCTTAAETVMTRDVTSCHGDALHDVLSKMKERGPVHVPIIDQDSKPVGVINAKYRFFAITSWASDTIDRGRHNSPLRRCRHGSLPEKRCCLAGSNGSSLRGARSRRFKWRLRTNVTSPSL